MPDYAAFRMKLLLKTAVVLFVVMTVSVQSVSGEVQDRKPQFLLESPTVQLRGYSTPKIRIVALTKDGDIDVEFNGTAKIQGVQFISDGKNLPLPGFEEGVFELKTDRAQNQHIMLTGNTVSVASEVTGKSATFQVRTLPGWVSIVPPLIAIVLAIWWQEVISALFLASLTGMALIATSPFSGMMQTVESLFISKLTSLGNAQIILFIMFLGAVIGIMTGSGGTQALVERLTVFVRNRKHGQMMTWFLGLMVFFDDYSNTLLVGSTMRSVMDRLRISREKLAFLVDSTAAPVAGLALISTWVGVELGYIRTAYEGLGLPTGEIFQTFVATIPYRLYPLLALIFVGQVAWSGRDFGPMLTAELNQQRLKPREDVVDGVEISSGATPLVRHALIPLFVLCACLGLALIDDFEASSRAMILASAAAVVSAILSVVLSGSYPLNRTIGMGIEGMKQMLPAVIILVLAWSIGTVCDSDHLNTAGYLVDSLGDHLSPHWLPLITFLLSAVVSFATGTSYGTMGLLIPLAVSIELQLLLGISVPLEDIGNHPLMLATIGSILGGAIFGDHCSPISDTTVLSSAATGCDHLSHVRTQLPYALTVAAIALCLGYIPIALGISPYLAILAGIVAQWLVLRIIGKTVEDSPPRPQAST